jgi:hypothetical protein
MSFKKTKTKCPQCLENQQEALKKQQLQQKYDQEALAIFKSQADKFKKDIEESADNPGLKNYYEKMLKKCHELWAEEVTRIELKQENIPTSKEPLSSAFQQQLDTIETRIDLLCQVAHIEDQGTVLSPFDPRRRELKDRCDKWDGFRTRISELRQDYETNVKQKFKSIVEGGKLSDIMAHRIAIFEINEGWNPKQTWLHRL